MAIGIFRSARTQFDAPEKNLSFRQIIQFALSLIQEALSIIRVDASVLLSFSNVSRSIGRRVAGRGSVTSMVPRVISSIIHSQRTGMLNASINLSLGISLAIRFQRSKSLGSNCSTNRKRRMFSLSIGEELSGDLGLT